MQFSTADSTSQLHTLLRPSQSSRKPKDGYFLRAESFFNVASYMDDVGYLQSYGDRSLHAQSHGEALLLSYPNAKILQFDATGITEVAYEDTEHCAVTRDFLNNSKRRLEQLLDDEPAAWKHSS